MSPRWALVHYTDCRSRSKFKSSSKIYGERKWFFGKIMMKEADQAKWETNNGLHLLGLTLRSLSLCIKRCLNNTEMVNELVGTAAHVANDLPAVHTVKGFSLLTFCSGTAVLPCRLGLLPCDSLELTAIAICYQGRQRADKHSLCHDMTAPPAKWETNRRHAEIWTLTKDLCNASDTTRSIKRGLETLWWSRTLLVKTGRN